MAVVSSGVCLQPQAWHIDGGVALLLVVLRAWLSLIFFHALATECGLVTHSVDRLAECEFRASWSALKWKQCQTLLHKISRHDVRVIIYDRSATPHRSRNKG